MMSTRSSGRWAFEPCLHITCALLSGWQGAWRTMYTYAACHQDESTNAPGGRAAEVFVVKPCTQDWVLEAATQAPILLKAAELSLQLSSRNPRISSLKCSV